MRNFLLAIAVLIATCTAGRAVDIYIQASPGDLPGWDPDFVDGAYRAGSAAGGWGRKFDGSSEGKYITYLRVWTIPSRMVALDLIMSGESKVIRLGGNGGDDGNQRTDLSKLDGAAAVDFTFQPGETITAFSMSKSYYGDYIGGIAFTTSKGRNFNIQASWGTYQNRDYWAELHSGILAGFTSQAGDAMNQLGPLFYLPLGTATKQVNIDQTTLEANGVIDEVVLDAITKKNMTNKDLVTTWSETKTVEVTTSWSITAGLEVYAEVEVSGGVPGVVEVGGKAGWKASVSGSTGNSTTTTRAVTITSTVTAAAGETVKFTALVNRGNCRGLPYTGTMTVPFPNGRILTYPIKGTFTGVSYSTVNITAIAVQN